MHSALFKGLVTTPKVALALNRQLFAALCPPPAKNISSAFCSHAHQKPMGAFSLGIAENRQVLFHFFFSKTVN
jgi:hypothetical protein